VGVLLSIYDFGQDCKLWIRNSYVPSPIDWILYYIQSWRCYSIISVYITEWFIYDRFDFAVYWTSLIDFYFTKFDGYFLNLSNFSFSVGYYAFPKAILLPPFKLFSVNIGWEIFVGSWTEFLTAIFPLLVSSSEVKFVFPYYFRYDPSDFSD
jgi:hypothetical protein